MTKDISEPITGEYEAINFDGLERRANYRTIAYREDILHILERKDAAAIIYQIISRWETEIKRPQIIKEIERRRQTKQPPLTAQEVEDTMWVYMSYNDFVRESGGAVGYNTVIRMLDYMIRTKKVVEQRENHDPRYPDYEYRINRSVVKELLKALPAEPVFTPKVPKKKEKSTQEGIGLDDSTQMGIPPYDSTQVGTDSTQEGIATTQMGTEVYPNGGTSHITTHNYSHNYNTERERIPAPESDTTFSPPSVGDAHASLTCFFCSKPKGANCCECGKPVCSEHGTHYYGEMIWCDLCLDVVDIVETHSQQGDRDVLLDTAGRLPAVATVRDAGKDSKRAVLPVEELDNTFLEKGQNLPTSTPAQPLPPGTEQAAPGQPAKGKGKKQAEVKAETPKSPPIEPPSEMPWGTRKCLQWFDFWRGGILIGKYKLMQASTCAKGLAEQFDEQTVIAVRNQMEADPYYIAKGGCDVCDVANNIHKYLKRKHLQVIPGKAKQQQHWGSSFDDPNYTMEGEFYTKPGQTLLTGVLVQ